ncbi:hypothetical protein [Dokdonella koreensis]|uniref:hypothetical protein n=1 Tax=Dokdonella koreensis TaxID=323415 RepID=UPI001237814A|nr:hypothetical protein [Dokdonella koreensis]
MRMEAEKSQRCMPFVRFMHRLFAGVSVALVTLTKTPRQASSESLGKIAAPIEAQAYWLIPLLLLAVPFFEWWRRKLESRATWKVVESALVELRDRIFPRSTDPTHYHRVTLFKRRRYCWVWRSWPGSGWMIPVARSCHTNRNSAAIFLAPDDGDRAEGIAGVAWTMEEMLFQENLPLLSVSSERAVIEDYAARTFLPVKRIASRIKDEKPPLARSICGIPVRVKGKNWGAIVVDSRNTTLDSEKIREHYKTVAGVLSKLLEGM